MTSQPTAPLWRGRALALLGIVLVAATMRTAVGAVSPLLDHIAVDVPLDAVVLSILGAAPPLAFGLAGLLAPALSRGLGLEGAILAATVVGGAGHLVRATAQEPGLLVAGSVLALLGAGSANVLMPPLVKRYFPDRIGFVTAAYVTVMSLGATVPPAIGVPVADAAGWRVALGSWALLAAVAAAPWLWQLLRRGRHVEKLDTEARGIEAAQAGLGRRLWGSALGWAMALLFGYSALVTYVVFAWLPVMLGDISGVGPVEGGVLLAVFAVCGMPLALVIPPLTLRMRSVIPLVLTGVVLYAAGFAGFLVLPAAAPVVWVLCIGVGSLVFPLTLTLINLRSRTHTGSVALSGFTQGIGYVIGAAGPVIVGILHDLTGGWTAPLWFLVGSAVLAIPALVTLRRPRYIEDDAQAGGT